MRRCGKQCKGIKDYGFSQSLIFKAWILYCLDKCGPQHGYEIISKFIETFKEYLDSFGISEMGFFYRTFRACELEGLVSSSWEMQESGPARRIYTLTSRGKEEFNKILEMLEATQVFIQKFINIVGGEKW